jgi:hypothetical protein
MTNVNNASLWALDVGRLGFGPTPLAMLSAIIILSVFVIALVAFSSLFTGAVIDKRWPADQPLTPSEVLWGESGGHVKKTFPGLDPTIARDLTQYIKTTKVGAGEQIVERGDLATHFILLKSGSVESIDANGTTVIKAGQSIGSDDILRRQPYSATVRTTAPTEIVKLAAEDYLAALALGMSDAEDDDVVAVLGSYFAEPPKASRGKTGLAPEPAPVIEEAVGWRPTWTSATHRVINQPLPGYVLPDGDAPTRTLSIDAEVEQFEDLMGWAHVRTNDGWQGWVNQNGLSNQ